MGEGRSILKILQASWDKNRFLDYLDANGMGIEGIADILIEILTQKKDNRARLKALQMVLEVAGLKEEKTKNEMNIFINQLNNMTHDQVSGMVMLGLKDAECRVIEEKASGSSSGNT